jgi:hypothetical protein
MKTQTISFEQILSFWNSFMGVINSYESFRELLDDTYFSYNEKEIIRAMIDMGND